MRYIVLKSVSGLILMLPRNYLEFGDRIEFGLNVDTIWRNT